MRIGAIRTEDPGTVAATIVWEDTDRAPFDLRFSFLSGDVPAAEPNAFLLAAFLAAARAGERRIAVEGSVCPVLRDGLRAAVDLLRTWYAAPFAAPALEPSTGFRVGYPPEGGGEAIFLSGGLDSLDLLLSRSAILPREHPSGVRRGVVVTRIGAVPGDPWVAEMAVRSQRAARAIAEWAALPLTVVSTNLPDLHTDVRAFTLESHGSFFGAIAQLLAGRIATAVLAASDDAVFGLKPWGSHPLLDPLFGTSAVRLVHDGIGLTRAEKAARVGRSAAARHHLFTCSYPLPGDPLPNCGRCEKCLRTMLELLVAGALGDSEVYPRDLSADAIRELPAVHAYRRLEYYWEPLVAAARRAGRGDLAEAIEERLGVARRAEAWERDRGWKGRLRRIDRRYLGGRLLAARRRLTRLPAIP